MIKSTKKTIVALSLLAALSACSQQESAQEYITQAKTAISEQNLSSSIIALKNAIQVEPKNAEARFLLGQAYLAQGNALSAVKELSIAHRSQYLPNEVVPLLARAHYLADEYEDTLAIKEQGLSTSSQLATQLYKVAVLTQQNKIKAADKQFLTMSQIDNESGYSSLAEAYIQLSKQDVALAKQKTEEALSKLPGQPEALLLLANIESINEEYAAAADNYRKYMAIQPMQRTTELLLANALLKDGQLEEAEKHADNIIKLIPNQPLANYVKAMVRVQNEDYELAHRHAEIALNNKFNQPNLKLVAGVSAFYLKKHEQVLHYLKPLENYLPRDHFARKMLVVSQIELGVIEDVADTLGNIDSNASNESGFYSALSYKLLQAGAQDEARKIIDAVVVNEQSAPELLKDGMLKMMLNDETALKSLEKAVALDPKLAQAELAIAYMAVNEGDYAKADSIARKWQEEQPTKPNGFNLAAAVAMKQGKLKVAKSLLEQSIAIRENIYAYMTLSQIAYGEENKSLAKELIQKAKAVSPDNIQVLRAEIQLDDTDGTLNELKSKIQAEPNNDLLKLVYAEALMQRKQVDDALSTLSDITPSINTPKFYWQLKVAGYRFNNNVNLLQNTLREWRDVSPYHIEPVIYLAEVYVIKKDFDMAIRVIDEGLAKHAGNLALKLIKVEVLISNKDVSGVNELWPQVESRVKEGATKSGIKGRIALLNKDFEVAIEELSISYQSQPTVRNVLLLTSALIGSDKKAESIKLLSQHLTEQSYSPQLASLLGSLYLEEEDSDRALIVFEAMVKEQPENIMALNNAAWLNMERDQLEKAKEYAKKAIDLAPEVPNVVDTYGKILLKGGQNRQALTLALKAFELSEGKDIDIALNYVETLLANKRNNKAKEILQSIKTQNKSQRHLDLEKQLAL